MRKMIGIYKITNLINNKCYIGQSVNIKERWKNHRTASHNPNDEGYDYPLYRAIRKYGLENFSFEVLEECKTEELNNKEKYYIDFYNSYKDGYNQTPGGQSNLFFSKLSKEQVSEIQEKLLSGKYMIKTLAEEYGVHRDTIRDINLGRSWINENLEYPLYIDPSWAGRLGLNKNYCIDCGKEISKGSKRCRQCDIAHRAELTTPKEKQSKYPDKEELIRDIKELGFTGAGRKYGVSDNAVRKHCKKLGLSTYRKDYK